MFRSQKNVLLVDPASMHDSDRNTGASFDIYRDETSAVSAAIDTQFNGLVKLEGVYFCESGKPQIILSFISLTAIRLLLPLKFLKNMLRI